MKSKSLFVLKLVFSVYLGAVIGFIILSLGSTKTDYLLKAISPSVLYKEIAAGNPVIIIFAILGLVLFILLK